MRLPSFQLQISLHTYRKAKVKINYVANMNKDNLLYVIFFVYIGLDIFMKCTRHKKFYLK